jgi:hypothetical protein
MTPGSSTWSQASDRVTIRTCATYQEAQRAVDYLSDHSFSVESLQIIGTDLRMVETVTGRLNWGRAALGGLASGAWFGLFVGVLLGLFSTDQSFFVWAIWGLLWGAGFGIVFGLVAYAASGGRRDFTSRSQVVAAQYLVTCDQAKAEEARTTLAAMPVR